MEFSPALSVNSDLTDEELDLYFASYVPLSNLPTPPPAKEHAIPQLASSPASPSQTHIYEAVNVNSSPELEAHASHLANLVPLNVSTHRPHASSIRGFLDRAGLPDEVVAFSACILDALSTRFVATWRDALAPSNYARDLKNFLRTDSSSRHAAHVSPDVIVLAALSLAHDFLIDRPRSSRHWAVMESAGTFTVQEIEASRRAILLDMEYGLFRISNERVQQRLQSMRLAAAPLPLLMSKAVEKQDRRRNLSLSLQGAAVWSYGMQTPEPSP